MRTGLDYHTCLALPFCPPYGEIHGNGALPGTFLGSAHPVTVRIMLPLSSSCYEIPSRPLARFHWGNAVLLKSDIAVAKISHGEQDTFVFWVVTSLTKLRCGWFLVVVSQGALWRSAGVLGEHKIYLCIYFCDGFIIGKSVIVYESSLYSSLFLLPHQREIPLPFIPGLEEVSASPELKESLWPMAPSTQQF